MALPGLLIQRASEEGGLHVATCDSTASSELCIYTLLRRESRYLITDEGLCRGRDLQDNLQSVDKLQHSRWQRGMGQLQMEGDWVVLTYGGAKLQQGVVGGQVLQPKDL